jgi:hypothetical protein
MDSGDNGGKTVQGIALPCAKIILSLLVIAFYHTGQYGKPLSVCPCRQYGPFCQFQTQIAF